MSGSYFGEPNLGSGRGGGSSRKNKKINSEKPKQPQRGLGVAQLEKIRLHGQIGSFHYPSIPSAYPSNFNQEDITMQTAYSSLPSSSFAYPSSSSASSASYNFHPNIMSGLGDYERTNIIHGDSQTFATASWNPSNNILEAQHFAQPIPTQHLPNSQAEDMQRKKNNKDHNRSLLGSSSQNCSESSDAQEELDLELRLSL